MMAVPAALMSLLGVATALRLSSVHRTAPRLVTCAAQARGLRMAQLPEQQEAEPPTAMTQQGTAADIGESAPESGSVLGATALVAGTTVGAGILALPAKTLAAGFVPSTFALCAAWAYMASSALLIAEANVNARYAVDRTSVSLNTMAEDTLGLAGSRIAGAAYVFIHYTLLVAYMLQGGTLLLELLPTQMHTTLPSFPQSALGPPLFAAIVGGAQVLGSQEQIERANNVLVVGVITSFVTLLALGSQQVDASLLSRADPSAVFPAIPVLVLSLVFHNVIPTIAYQLGCDMSRIRSAILWGSAIPTLMFISWDAVVLGVVPFDTAAATTAAAIVDPLESLRGSGSLFGETVRAFSLLAIITSFIGFVYGLVDFLADALGVEVAEMEDTGGDVTGTSTSSVEAFATRAGLYALTLLPPLAIALSDPTLFFAALDSAGTFGILVLFGIYPPLMVWQQRYGPAAAPAVEPALPGGRVTLAGIGMAAATVVGTEGFQRIADALM